MKANLDIENVTSFSKNIEQQRVIVNEKSSQLNEMADEASAQIKEEQNKCVEAIEKCTEGLAKLSNKINKYNEKISDLSSKLSTIPPKIKRYVDEEGFIEEDNPEYVDLQNQIVLLQNQLRVLTILLNKIENVMHQLSQQLDLLKSGLEQITQIKESIDGCNTSISGLSFEAVGKLDQIQDVLQEYKNIRLDASSLSSIGKRGVSIWENIAPNTPDILNDTTKSAMQKLADYMRRHNYGMGDKDKYMQDPEWIALNGALQEEIKEQEHIMEERMDVRTPTNPNGLMYYGPYDDDNTPLSDGPSGIDGNDCDHRDTDDNLKYDYGNEPYDGGTEIEIVKDEKTGEDISSYLPKSLEANKVWNKYLHVEKKVLTIVKGVVMDVIPMIHSIANPTPVSVQQQNNMSIHPQTELARSIDYEALANTGFVTFATENGMEVTLSLNNAIPSCNAPESPQYNGKKLEEYLKDQVSALNDLLNEEVTQKKENAESAYEELSNDRYRSKIYSPLSEEDGEIVFGNENITIRIKKDDSQ